MSVAAACARVPRVTAFLFALGVSAASSGAWLLHDMAVGETARALGRARTHESAPPRLPSSGSREAPALAMLGTVPRLAGPSGRPEDPIDVRFVELVEVRASVPGRVASVRFESGSRVQKGDTLLVLDPASFIAAVQAAQTDLADARTHLAAATAALGRSQRAFDAGQIGAQELDVVVRAQREKIGAMRHAEATLEDARRRLARTHVVAPTDGRVAEVRVRVGDRVTGTPDDRALITIVSPEAVYARAAMGPRDQA